MSTSKDLKLVYAKESIDFMTVAVNYCIFLENINHETEQKDFISRLTKLLPLLYTQARMLPEIEELDDYGMLENPVTEDDYNFILDKATNVLGRHNDYLEVFVEDMRYSEEPIICHIAEGLADIYQDLRNCAAIYERGIEEHMYEALYNCMENFKLYWGQTLLNILRALHHIEFASLTDDEFDDFNEGEADFNYEEEEW